jgi:hypothetical protein
MGRPTLLMTESQDEFDALAVAMLAYINPQDIVEPMIVWNVIEITWHILRLGRCRADVINIGFRNALLKLLVVELGLAEHVAEKWFTSNTTKEEIINLLKTYNLDEPSIAAEAIMNNLTSLEALDRVLALWDARRSKAFRTLGEVRLSLAKRAREISEEIIEKQGLRMSGQQAAE